MQIEKPKRVKRKRFDINALSEQERLEYWNGVTEDHLFSFYKPRTVKFVREKTKEFTDSMFELNGGKLTAHEPGCAYAMTLRDINPDIHYLGTDPAENMIIQDRQIYTDLPNAKFEVDSVETGHGKYRHDVLLMLCMLDSLPHEYSMTLIPLMADMCERGMLFVSLRHEKNNSLKEDWNYYRNFNSHNPEEIQELADKLGFDCELDVRENFSNFAAVWTRR